MGLKSGFRRLMFHLLPCVLGVVPVLAFCLYNVVVKQNLDNIFEVSQCMNDPISASYSKSLALKEI